MGMVVTASHHGAPYRTQAEPTYGAQSSPEYLPPDTHSLCQIVGITEAHEVRSRQGEHVVTKVCCFSGGPFRLSTAQVVATSAEPHGEACANPAGKSETIK